MTPDKHLEGVFTATRKDGSTYYRSSITYRRKHISLGSYPTALEAHHAYMAARSILDSEHSFALSDYGQSSPLSFEKWVCLLNFRDNGIYLGHPIYIHHRFFNYYLSPEHILKFDIDDLFYYTSHKIMCRGNHYFVADYGMQVNIASRYGIKNYAVAGRDFCFINGDATDFRRENIQVWNAYHGVTHTQKNGQCRYTVRIHIRGNYLVGHYETAIEAAVAYNKAIDILQKKGLRRKFSPNYIEELSPSQYAELYSNITIAPGILNYRSEK